MSINFQYYEKDIVAKARIYSVPGMEWEDVAQELRLHLWMKRDKFDPSKNVQEKTFVMRILMNKIKDLQKAANRQKRFLDTHHFVFSDIEKEEGGEQILANAVPFNFLGLIVAYV